ncbi:MAG: 23S rRNA (adenine(2503)-C(2))-methyltransferase RlmN [Parcubacteria group bacterium]|nr:23S rRNA (adenine(2503)-C(2))-methyltransferase RlmN [Parcubacteria group bacterium]
MTQPQTRLEQFRALFPSEPRFRWEQIARALYQPQINDWQGITTLSKPMREQIVAIPFVSYKEARVLTSKSGDTYKVMMTLLDGSQIETVLMANKRGQWTICVSSQVGCAQRCGFCATGRMGFKRNLTIDEIVDQYRYWNYFLREKKPKHPEAEPRVEARVSNIVFMGMGEPLANYDTVKETINQWLKFTDIGRTHITVSTVGMLPILDKILDDADWPHVRLAVSVHSAEPSTRKEIVPTSYDGFLEKLQDWAKRYLAKFGNNKHHLTFEYVMLRDVNDTAHHAQALYKFVNKAGHVKVNLIPYNITDNPYKRSLDPVVADFKTMLEAHGVTCTIRKTMGEDIAAACGQLIKLGKKTAVKAS